MAKDNPSTDHALMVKLDALAFTSNQADCRGHGTSRLLAGYNRESLAFWTRYMLHWIYLANFSALDHPATRALYYYQKKKKLTEADKSD